MREKIPSMEEMREDVKDLKEDLGKRIFEEVQEWCKFNFVPLPKLKIFKVLKIVAGCSLLLLAGYFGFCFYERLIIQLIVIGVVEMVLSIDIILFNYFLLRKIEQGINEVRNEKQLLHFTLCVGVRTLEKRQEKMLTSSKIKK